MRFSWLTILFLFQLLLRVSCQDKPVQENFTIVADDNPISRAFGKKRDTIRDLLKHIEYIDRAILQATKEANKDPNDKTEKSDQEPPTSCNHRNDGWNEDLKKYFEHRKWAELNADCVSDVYGAGAKDGVPILKTKEKGISKEEAYDVVVRHAKAADGIAADAIKNAGLTNDPDWKKAKHVEPERAFEFKYDDGTQECTYDYAAFIREKGQWYVAERITNSVSKLARHAGKRKYLFEYIDGNGKSLQVGVPKGNNTINGTTIQLTSSGFVTASEFGRIFPESNPAVQSAISEGEHATQQAQDATTASNIAILALPLMLNIVPVALIAETNNLGMLLYTLLTDVLTAVPLAIKGVEVLTIGKTQRYSVVTRFTGGNLEAEDPEIADNKAGEVWAARCSSADKFTARGVVFLTVALTFMIVGIILEFAARKWKRRKGPKQKIAGINGFTTTPQSGHTVAPPNSSTQIHPSNANLFPGQHNFTYSNQNIDEEMGASTSVGLEHPAAAVLAIAQSRERNANEEGHWWRRNRRRDQNDNALRGHSAYPSLPDYDDDKTAQQKND